MNCDPNIVGIVYVYTCMLMGVTTTHIGGSSVRLTYII